MRINLIRNLHHDNDSQFFEVTYDAINRHSFYFDADCGDSFSFCRGGGYHNDTNLGWECSSS